VVPRRQDGSYWGTERAELRIGSWRQKGGADTSVVVAFPILGAFDLDFPGKLSGRR
jgi:hypothetical protein